MLDAALERERALQHYTALAAEAKDEDLARLDMYCEADVEAILAIDGFSRVFDN